MRYSFPMRNYEFPHFDKGVNIKRESISEENFSGKKFPYCRFRLTERFLQIIINNCHIKTIFELQLVLRFTDPFLDFFRGFRGPAMQPMYQYFESRRLNKNGKGIFRKLL